MFRRTALGLATGLALALNSFSAAAETVTIRYSNWLPPGLFLWDDVIVPWLGEIEKVTEGRVKVEVAPKVVGTAASQYDVVRDGLADLSWMVAGYTPGRFPLVELGDLPLIGPKAEALGPTFDRMYRKHLEEKNVFDGVYPVSLLVITPLQMVTKGKQVNSVDELQGMKFRSSSPTLTEVLKLLGVVPILKSAAEAYEMLSTGVIDGQVTNLNTIPGFNQLDLMDGIYHVPGGLANAVIIMGLNADKWAEISPEDQEAIKAISGEAFARKVGAAYDAADARALVAMEKAGYHMGKATPEQIEQIRARLKPIEAAWIEKAKGAGLDNAAEILDEWKQAVAAEPVSQ
jgi:TRAP-type C4-dicarboxylate transport system substrate-binding protein